jgi:hypothetical protein
MPQAAFVTFLESQATFGTVSEYLAAFRKYLGSQAAFGKGFRVIGSFLKREPVWFIRISNRSQQKLNFNYPYKNASKNV